MEITKQYSRNRHKLSVEKQTMPSIDRLSGLPDAILCHILSFLHTKLSAATSILSRRWRFLWAHVPNLDFDNDKLEIPTRLSEIVNMVMLLYKVQSLDTFRLYTTEPDFSNYQLETWITFAIARDVQNLALDLNYEVALPQCLFNCKTLVDLTIYCSGNIPLTGPIWLPRLKKLELYSVVYESNESLPRLLSGCPVLEDLAIDYDLECEDLDCWYISSPTIKKLTVNFWDPDNHAFRLEVNTPALRYLMIPTCSFTLISFGPLTSLIEAKIGLFIKKMEIGDDILHCRALLEIVGRLCHVKFLKFSCDVKVVDSTFAAWSIRFNNLTKLQWNADLRLLSKILENADNLEALIIDQVYRDPRCWTIPQQVPKCLLSHLRTIEIHQFGGTENEFEIVKYLLRNAQVLTRMKIRSQWALIDLDAKFDALRRISLFRRGSVECELDFL